MVSFAGPFFVAAVLLGAAGVAKIVRPGAARAALASVRLPATDRTVRVLGVTELAVAVAALWPGGTVAALAVAAFYLAFAAFVGYALARGGTLRSCGCFGEPDTPPTRVHVVVNLALATTAGVVAAGPAPSLPAVLGAQPLWGVPLLAAVGLSAWLAYLTLSALPAVSALVAERAR